MSKLTISTIVEQRGRCVHQSGCPGRFADIVLRIEPHPHKEGVLFTVVELPNDQTETKFYVSGVEKGIQAFAERVGVVDTHVTLISVKIHPVDSNELAFKLAAMQAMEEAFAKYGIRVE